MRVTVTELKRMIAESVAKHIKEQELPANADARIRANATDHSPPSYAAPLAGRQRSGGVPPAPRSASTSASTPATTNEIRKMVREVIEEMMDNEKVNEEMYEAEKLKEAVKKMVRAELKRSGR